MSEPWWRALLREQQGSGFRDLAGSEATVRLPISDRLLTSLVASRLPSSAPVSSIAVQAARGDQFSVRLKLKAPAFLPPFTIRFAIIGQPELPGSPILSCVMLTQGLAPFMGSLVRLFATLPPWIRVDQDRVLVNLRLLAAEQGLADLLALVTDLRLTTTSGTFVLSARAALPGSDQQV